MRSHISQEATILPLSAPIDGKGGYLTPGLIDIHWHMGMGTTEQEYFAGDQNYVAIHSAKEAGEQLMRGVTTVRDPSGNASAQGMGRSKWSRRERRQHYAR